MIVDMNEAMAAFNSLVHEHMARETRVPVRPPVVPERAFDELHLALSEHGQPFDDVVELLRGVLAVTPSTASSRFFNQLFAGRDGAAVLGDALATVLNNSMYTYKVAGAHVLMELELVKRMGRLMGIEDAEGVFTPGGSLSNLCGMVLARGEAMPDLKEKGADGRVGRIYTSVDSHYSVRKAAGLLGIGRSNVVRIPVDGEGRMRADLLARAIDADVAEGRVPLMVNATAGTTVLGAFDDLHAIADVCEARGIWLHVDAAYGGSMIFHPKVRPSLAGTERADSITWDAHKMMGVPLTCSVILVRHKGLLTKHMNETASYLFQDDSDDLNPGTRSLQCGRRNSALKLWTAWKTHGDEGYRRRMQTLRANTLYARDCVVEDDDLTLVREPASLNLCFRVRGVQADVLCTALNVQGRAMVGHANVDGEAVVRAVFLDPRTASPDIDQFFEDLRHVADVLRNAAA